MAHSFTEHDALRIWCVKCGCLNTHERAREPCPTAGKHIYGFTLFCVCSLLDMLSARVFIHAPIHSYCLIVVLCVFDTAGTFLALISVIQFKCYSIGSSECWSR
jgi:hypothetical protein